MTQAQRIIEKLGGTRKAAAILDKPPSTVQSWKQAGFVPARAQSEVVDRAAAAGIVISPSDFFVAAEPAPASAI